MINILYSLLCRDFHNSMIKKVRTKLDVGHELAITEIEDEFCKSVEKVFEFADVCVGDYQKYEEFRDCEPIDETIIKSMEPYELVILEMMNRPHSYKLSFDERIILYFKHIRFWNYILDKYEINHVVFTSLPHEVFDYTIYCLCKVKNIPTHSFYSVIGFYDIYPRAVICRDYSGENKRLKLFMDNNEGYNDDGWKPILEKFKTTTANDIDEAEHNRSFTFINPKEKYEYFAYYFTRAYLEKKYIENKNIGVTGAQGYLVNEHQIIAKFLYKYYYFKIKHNSRLLRKEYNRRTSQPNNDDKYFYYALHFQPEESSCPRGGGIYANQWLPIQILSGCLPDGFFLYVKEHPIQTNIGRSKTFYDELLKLGNVKLVPYETNQLKLIRNSYAVATLTGTICLEGVVNGTPCISFGESLWNCMEGVFPVRTTEECKKAVFKIVNGDYSIDNEKIEKYFGAIQAFSSDCNHWCEPYDPVKSAIATSEMIIRDIEEYENNRLD